MRRILNSIYRVIQRYILVLSYFFYKHLMRKVAAKESWVIGVQDVANNIAQLGKILPDSTTVSLIQCNFYSSRYDIALSPSTGISKKIYTIIYRPYLLAKLAAVKQNFWYVWRTGFLRNLEDELYYLKKWNKQIVWLFCGDDIRSPKLYKEYHTEQKIDTYVDYIGFYDKKYLSEAYELEKKKIAMLADKFADVVFSAEIDQISYMKKKVYFVSYMYDEEDLYYSQEKHQSTTIKVLHAPSNPLFKGTPLVRAAIKKLKGEGYTFDYVELMNVSNDIVKKHLKDSQIVLNQFYSFIPGLFGIEAMGHHCAVLMSADRRIEKSLPQDSEEAWVTTGYWEVYDKLKYLLDNPEKIKYYADNGYQFVKSNYNYNNVIKYIYGILKNTDLD